MYHNQQSRWWQESNFENAQQALREVILGKAEAAAGKKQKQALIDKILTACPIKSAKSSIKIIYQWRVWSQSHCQTVSCEWNRLAHGHIQMKISNKLSPETAE